MAALVALAVGVAIAFYILDLVHQRDHAAVKASLAQELAGQAEIQRDDAAEKARRAQELRGQAER